MCNMYNIVGVKWLHSCEKKNGNVTGPSKKNGEKEHKHGQYKQGKKQGCVLVGSNQGQKNRADTKTY